MTTATTPTTVPDEWDRRLTSRAERYAAGKALRSKASRSSHGEQVVVGQRLMQAASDIFLGWTTYNGRDYYVRQLRDMKWSAEVEGMDPVLFTAYVELCATTLARAHARTGDSARIAGYLGNRDVFDQAIATFAETYADQAERDHTALLAAIKDGRVQAQTDV